MFCSTLATSGVSNLLQLEMGEGGDRHLPQAMLTYLASAPEANYAASPHVQVLALGLHADPHDSGHQMCGQARIHAGFKDHPVLNHSTVQPCTMAWRPSGTPTWLVQASFEDDVDSGGSDLGPQPFLTIVPGERDEAARSKDDMWAGLFTGAATPDIPTVARLRALLALFILAFTNRGGKQTYLLGVASLSPDFDTLAMPSTLRPSILDASFVPAQGGDLTLLHDAVKATGAAGISATFGLTLTPIQTYNAAKVACVVMDAGLKLSVCPRFWWAIGNTAGGVLLASPGILWDVIGWGCQRTTLRAALKVGLCGFTVTQLRLGS